MSAPLSPPGTHHGGCLRPGKPHSSENGNGTRSQALALENLLDLLALYDHLISNGRLILI